MKEQALSQVAAKPNRMLQLHANLRDYQVD